MAVLQMQRIFLCALKKERKQILELLQRRGVIEIEDMDNTDNVFQKMDVSVAKNGFEKTISVARDAVSILDTYVPEKKSMLASLNGRHEVSTDVYDDFFDKHDDTLRIAHRIIALSKEIAEQKGEILKLDTQVEMLTPWITFDIPMNFSGTRYTKAFIGTLPDLWTMDAIYERLADFTPLNVDIVSATKDQTCIFVLSPKDKADAVYDVLRGMEFTHPSSTFNKAPAEQLEILKDRIKKANEAINKAKDEIISYADKKEDLLFLQDYDTMRAEKYEVIGHVLQSKNVFVLQGYIPKRDALKVSEELSAKFLVSVELEDPSEDDEVPVLLDNIGFSKPLEGVVAAYSPPGKGEVDPTMVMSLFYYLLFGLMLSDVGYGGIITLACAILLIKFKDTMETSNKGSLKMFLYCGISTMFWGAMFGSYFSDIVTVIAETYFGRTVVIEPLWFTPMSQPMRMLAFSLVFGIIHLFAGIGMKFYQLILIKDYKSILYDVVTWFVLLISAIIVLLSMDMIKNIFSLNINMPTGLVNGASITALLASLGIILTGGRASKNPVKRILKGIFELYGISGYLSDVLSYSRLLALGLATGVIGMVINQMAGMAGGGPLGPVIFLIIFVVGHTVNLGINALGAYVHTNRLQYVEFFGKFYEGGGREFKPFSVKTKYYKFKEKMKNEV
ncbi:V-type ATP synthase subunit I [Mobilitalea sibirica]|uniref:V-type ATP synthase subunit I n=1 Tax=Mobilitalea sibirica TaxID=1462919 RepID=A0A8J7KUC8_9FIRM|nr:V-type ATP synthase subunit I [Mobilitalea sibirica]MBH1942351.1 V-type ATP synthase subunit I [Mobilitalea sibirica]